eukprot:CAMPEP_0172550352 /NCGR_PEP_ID=MMETSP1067-20121228/28984_1 /TAXON_ID=265564 ORGANISM="Thalassiosira punctigera, Strain Tpunct2005C2" /NCGR_SAMPLE_ID=MMETSP1067 /ASSEMBLY_ACC=CAM_ASM_000444 /LENGTH=51 /DNA_ID=CAMNT_0013337915 /DNA_START=30 /DNA_END=183 /DNA_ORIENTATION=+
MTRAPLPYQFSLDEGNVSLALAMPFSTSALLPALPFVALAIVPALIFVALA